MHIYCSDVRSHSSAPESNNQNPRDRTLDLPFFFRYKYIPSLKNLPSPAQNVSSPYWFQGNFAASFALNFCLREFLLSAFANRFELRCEPKRLMLLYYKIGPCLSHKRCPKSIPCRVNFFSKVYITQCFKRTLKKILPHDTLSHNFLTNCSTLALDFIRKGDPVAYFFTATRDPVERHNPSSQVWECLVPPPPFLEFQHAINRNDRLQPAIRRHIFSFILNQTACTLSVSYQWLKFMNDVSGGRCNFIINRKARRKTTNIFSQSCL